MLLLGSGGNLGCGLNILRVPGYFTGLWEPRNQVFEIKFVLEDMGHISGKYKPCICFYLVLLLVPCCSGGGVGV